MSMPTAPARADRDAPLLRVLDDLQRVRVLEQRLGRDAAPQQAGAAERLLLLDDGDLQSELRGADRGHVAAGAGADDDDVVFVGHGVISARRRLPLQRRQRHEGGRRRPRRRRRRPAGRLLRVEPVDARAQLPVLVPQLPVRFGQPFEPLGEPPRPHERRERRPATAAPVSSQ